MDRQRRQLIKPTLIEGKPTLTFHNRNHAIVIDIHEDFPITDYVVAVGSLVGPQQRRIQLLEFQMTEYAYI